MASIKNLKKDINYVLGDIIEAVYITELATQKTNSEEGNEIIEEAIATFDELLQKLTTRKLRTESLILRKLAKS